MIGEMISSFEKRFYHDSHIRGLWLVVTILTITGSIAFVVTYFAHPLIIALLASIFLAHHMLYESVKNAIGDREKLAYLVSRDTHMLSESDAHKALIETYAENLSDGVIAPLFYLLIFGFTGLVLYKTVNTLDSMVGYKTTHYKNYGYVSARLDDILNLLPARITALIIMIAGKSWDFKTLFSHAKGHASPNAGYPITAMALIYHLRLGGDTPYHGKIIKKPYFGVGKKIVTEQDVLDVLKIKKKIDIIIIGGLLGTTIYWFK